MKTGENLLEAPEEVVGPGEAFFRRIAAVIVGFPRIVGGDAGHLVQFGDVGDRVAVDRPARRGDDVDLVLEDQLVGDLGRAAFVGLAVLGDDLDLVRLAADLDAGSKACGCRQGPILRFGEARHRTGHRADMADPDDIVGRPEDRRLEDRRRRQCRRAGLEHGPARHAAGRTRAALASN